MSSPQTMRTGFRTSHDIPYPEVFFVIILIFNAILRRNGYVDAMTYAKHNKTNRDDLFVTGVFFNLYSELGVGKRLEPLLVELFKTFTLCPDNNSENPFFKAVVDLFYEAQNVVKSKDMTKEVRFLYKYAIDDALCDDSIYRERQERLNLGDRIGTNECKCHFCNEFRSFDDSAHISPRDINKAINTLLIKISRSITA